MYPARVGRCTVRDSLTSHRSSIVILHRSFRGGGENQEIQLWTFFFCEGLIFFESVKGTVAPLVVIEVDRDD